MRTRADQQRTKVAVAREGKTQLETLVDRARELPAAGRATAGRRQTPRSLTFPQRQRADVYLSIGRLANISVVFDPGFAIRTSRSICATHRSKSALDAVSHATRNFYRVTGDRVVTVIPDTAAKRREYEEEVVKTFYLSNADLKETIDLLRTVVDARRIAPITGTNALTIKDTPERVELRPASSPPSTRHVPKSSSTSSYSKSIARKLKEYGLQIASPGSPGIDGAADVNRDGVHAARPAHADAVGRVPHQPAGAVLPSAQAGHQHPHARQPAAPHDGRHHHRGPLGRAGAGPADHVLADRHRRRCAAADHVVRLREHRREPRHHAAHCTTTTRCRWR